MTIFTYLFVKSVEERSETVRGFKKQDGTVEIETRSTGWWITFTNGMSLGVGSSQPDLVPDDKIILALKRMPRDEQRNNNNPQPDGVNPDTNYSYLVPPASKCPPSGSIRSGEDLSRRDPDRSGD